jgi:capsular exopolysaccharide synthesis family protein
MVDRSLPPSDPDRDRGRVPAEYAPPTGGISGYGPVPSRWNDEDEGSVDWRRYLAAVGRHKILVLSMVALGVAAGFVVHQFVSPTYEAAATVWIDAGPGGTGDQEPIRPRQLLESYGWVDLMRSYVVLDPVVHELSLFVRPADRSDTPAFRGFQLASAYETGRYRLEVSESGDEMTLSARSDDWEIREAAPVGGSIGSDLGFHWTPPPDLLVRGRVIEFSVLSPRDAARQLAESLDVRIDGNGTFLRVAVEGDDPRRITDVVNSVVERYVDVAAELKRAQLDELTEILEEQLTYAEDNLRQAELELENFKVQTISLPSEPSAPVAAGLEQTRDPVFSNFFNLKVQQEEIRQDQVAIERALGLSESQGRLAVEALEVIPTVRESSDIMHGLSLTTEKRADLRALRLRYTDEHPSVQRLAADLEELEMETIPALLGSLRTEIGSRQNQLTEFVNEASRELQQIPTRAIEEARLERRFRAAEGLFEDLQGRYESARLAAASTIADVRVLDRAQAPTFPQTDPRGRFFALAALAGLGLGLLGAVLRDRADPRLRYPDQVTRELGLPILGTIPHVRKRNGQLRAGEHDQVVEAFRNLRLAVTYAHGGGESLVLTLTSPGVGDGKSFCTSNLALAFAELGHRTLIVDGDVRRGTSHTLFARDRKPGLTDFLAGEAGVDDVIQETDHPALSLIASGSRFRDGPELLGTAEMQQLVREARSRFEVVLIDSPPMGAAVDPYLLATLSGSLLVVLRNGTTDRDFAGAKLSDLERLPVRLLGAVLNDVPSGSGPYKYYSYLPGYGVADEDAPGRALAGKAG